jgi:hypothetical protein
MKAFVKSRAVAVASVSSIPAMAIARADLACADPSQTCTPPPLGARRYTHRLEHHLLQPRRQLSGLHVAWDGGQWTLGSGTTIRPAS